MNPYDWILHGRADFFLPFCIYLSGFVLDIAFINVRDEGFVLHDDNYDDEPKTKRIKVTKRYLKGIRKE